VTPVGQFLTMLITIVGLGLVALPTGILASGFTEKMRQQTDEYKQLLEQKVSDGVLTRKEQIELSIEASSLGISKIRQSEIQAEELSALEREQKEDAFLAEPRLSPSAANIKTTIVGDRSMPASDFEDLMTQVERLSLSEKSRLMARISEDMARRIDVETKE
jgi:hypothetical protein